jgi:hypothetical protein
MLRDVVLTLRDVVLTLRDVVLTLRDLWRIQLCTALTGRHWALSVPGHLWRIQLCTALTGHHWALSVHCAAVHCRVTSGEFSFALH